MPCYTVVSLRGPAVSAVRHVEFFDKVDPWTSLLRTHDFFQITIFDGFLLSNKIGRRDDFQRNTSQPWNPNTLFFFVGEWSQSELDHYFNLEILWIFDYVTLYTSPIFTQILWTGYRHTGWDYWSAIPLSLPLSPQSGTHRGKGDSSCN